MTETPKINTKVYTKDDRKAPDLAISSTEIDDKILESAVFKQMVGQIKGELSEIDVSTITDMEDKTPEQKLLIAKSGIINKYLEDALTGTGAGKEIKDTSKQETMGITHGVYETLEKDTPVKEVMNIHANTTGSADFESFKIDVTALSGENDKEKFVANLLNRLAKESLIASREEGKDITDELKNEENNILLSVMKKEEDIEIGKTQDTLSSYKKELEEKIATNKNTGSDISLPEEVDEWFPGVKKFWFGLGGALSWVASTFGGIDLNAYGFSSFTKQDGFGELLQKTKVNIEKLADDRTLTAITTDASAGIASMTNLFTSFSSLPEKAFKTYEKVADAAGDAVAALNSNAPTKDASGEVSSPQDVTNKSDPSIPAGMSGVTGVGGTVTMS